MTEQEQINVLKQNIAKLAAELNHLKIVLSQFACMISDPPSPPSCGLCGVTMYEGATCGHAASDCPMGIGYL